MTTYSSFDSGEIDPEELQFLSRRAKGGFAAVMTAACYIHPSGHAFKGQWSCHDDKFLPSLISAAKAIQQGGAKAILQIHHGGRQCPGKLCGGQPVAPSAVAYDRPNAEVPRELTEAEIYELIEAYGDAARRAEQAGFDGVEIHGANTYLLQQFVSPQSNLRTDKWNANDLLFVRRVVENVKAKVSPDYCVGYRFSPEEPSEPGIRLEHTERLINLLCSCSLAFLHVSLSQYDQPSLHDKESEPILSILLRYLNGRLPLISVGAINDLESANNAMELGSTALAVGKCAITDPDFVQKLIAGERPIMTLPAGDFRETLNIPTGLYEKIEQVPDWIPRAAT